MVNSKREDNTQFEVMVFKWEIIPRIKQWRESHLKDNEFLTLGVAK